MYTHPQIDQQVTFLYTDSLDASTEFYEQKLGLELWLDQESCRIYTVSGSGYLGLRQDANRRMLEEALKNTKRPPNWPFD